jgi:hypothetical protein
LGSPQKVARFGAAKEMLRIFHESETNGFDGIATGDESRFQHATASPKIFARSGANVIPRTWQVVGAKKTITTVFFTTKKFIVLNVLSRGNTFNQLYFPNNIFPDLKTANLIFWRQKTRSIFWAHMKLSMCCNGSKFTSKLRKPHFQNAAPALFTRYRHV